MMTTLEQKKLSRSFRRLISHDETLSKEDSVKILDAINNLCDDINKKRFKCRIKIREVESLLKNKEHIQARRGFFGMVKLFKKRDIIRDIF